MIYTPAMKAEVHKIRVPHDFQMDIVEYDFGQPFIALRFFESHWRYYTDNDRADVLLYMNAVKEIIEAYGVPVTLDPVYDVPGGQTFG